MGFSIKRKAKNMGDAVRLNCLECMGGNDGFIDQFGRKAGPSRPHQQVAECSEEERCHLWPYRFGKDPARSRGKSRPMTEERRLQLAAASALAQEKRRANRQGDGDEGAG